MECYTPAFFSASSALSAIVNHHFEGLQRRAGLRETPDVAPDCHPLRVPLATTSAAMFSASSSVAAFGPPAATTGNGHSPRSAPYAAWSPQYGTLITSTPHSTAHRTAQAMSSGANDTSGAGALESTRVGVHDDRHAPPLGIAHGIQRRAGRCTASLEPRTVAAGGERVRATVRHLPEYTGARRPCQSGRPITDWIIKGTRPASGGQHVFATPMCIVTASGRPATSTSSVDRRSRNSLGQSGLVPDEVIDSYAAKPPGGTAEQPCPGESPCQDPSDGPSHCQVSGEHARRNAGGLRNLRASFELM